MQINQDVIAVLEAAEISGNHLRLTGQLDRKLYAKTNDALVAAGGKWNRSAKAHVFGECPHDVVDRMIATGSILVPQDFGFFETSDELAQKVVEEAEILPHHLVLEPSAGTGRIARRASEKATVDAIEYLPKNAAALLTGGFVNNLTIGDFLTVVPEAKYDRVVMNPPFEKQADIRHVMHALKFLKPGGRLVAIMSASVQFRSNKLTADFREMVEAGGGTIESLPEGSFKQSGTMVNTVMVAISI